MLLTIHNLPLDTRYSDVKALIKEKCGLTEVILDNMSSEGSGKKVMVGLADEGDAAFLVRKVNGLFIKGQQLYVVDVRQKKESEQPYRKSSDFMQNTANNFETQQSFQEINYPIHNTLQAANNYQSPTNYQPPTNYYQPTTNYLPSTNYQSQTNYQETNQYLAPNDNYYQKSAVPQMVPPPEKVYDNLPAYYRSSDTQNSFSSFSEHQQQVIPPLMAPINCGNQNQGFKFGQDNRFDQGMPRDWRRDRSPSSVWDKRPQSLTRDNRFDQDRLSKTRELVDNKSRDSSRAKRFRSRSPPRDRYQHNPKSNFRIDDGNQNPKSFKKLEYNSPSKIVTPKSLFDYSIQQSHSSNQSEFNTQDFSIDSSNSRRPGPYCYGNHVTNTSVNIKLEKKPFDGHENRDIFQSPNKFMSPKPMKYRNEGKTYPLTRKIFKKGVGYLGTKRKFDDQNKYHKFSKEGENIKPAKQNLIPNKNLRRVPIVKKAVKNDSQNDIHSLLKRDSTWRDQATSHFANALLKKFAKLSLGINSLELRKQLKFSIRSRINIMLGESFGVPLKTIVDMYRRKFPANTDSDFLISIVQKIKENPQNQDNEKLDLITDNNLDVIKNENTVKGKLPKYPNADKSAYKELKKIQRAEFEDENIYFSNLEPELQKALNEELTALDEMILKVCEYPEDEIDKVVCKSVVEKSSPDFKGVISTNVTKRLLNICTNLIIKIYYTHKPPKLESLSEFLKQYGAISLKKSDKGKFLVATLDSYENYDKLCNLRTFTIDEISLNFKPYQIAGPPPKIARADILKQRDVLIKQELKSDGDSENPKTKSNEGDNVASDEGGNETINDGENVTNDEDNIVSNEVTNKSDVVTNKDNQNVMSNADPDVSKANPDVSKANPDVSNAVAGVSSSDQDEANMTDESSTIDDFEVNINNVDDDDLEDY